MLEAHKLTVKFSTNTIAVRNATFAIRPGEVVTLCGPNGAGKSTLLSALAGDQLATVGHTFIDGQRLSSLKPSDLARKRAVLEQSPGLTAAFTVSQLAGLSVGIDVSPTDTCQIIDQALKDVGLLGDAQKYVALLSGGQRHRAHLARVLSQLAAAGEQSGKYLLMDEPTSSLDLAHQISVMKVARRVAARGVGVLIVLHDLNLAAAFSDRVALMHRGELLLEGPPIDVFTEDLLSDVYETALKVEVFSSKSIQVTPVYT